MSRTEQAPKSVRNSDRRVRRTRKLLHSAFLELVIEKGYDKITIQDILDRADVGRTGSGIERHAAERRAVAGADQTGSGARR